MYAGTSTVVQLNGPVKTEIIARLNCACNGAVMEEFLYQNTISPLRPIIICQVHIYAYNADALMHLFAVC